jgi:molecular chaperone DnaJ
MISEKPHDRFVRHGSDIITEWPITLATAALGGEIEVNTLESKVKLKIPAGTQSGEILKLKGQGLGKLRSGGRGDLLVKVALWTPSSLTADQKKLYEQLRRLDGEVPPKVAKSIFERFRESLEV